MVKESFHVYMNLDVVNNSTNDAQPLIFSETRTIPFLANAEDYFLTVVRFTLQTANSLPVFIPDIIVGQTNPYKTVYEIGMYIRQGSVTKVVKANVAYTGTDATLPEPDPPLTQVDTSTKYYWVFNVLDWVGMLNRTFTTLTADILTDKSISSFNAPFVQYDITTGLFTLSVEQNAMASYSLLVFFNARLYNILPFPATYQKNPLLQSPDGCYVINIMNSNANQKTLLIAGTKTDFLTTITEFSPLPLMNPIRNIYFTTNQLPIQPTLSQPPKVYNDTNLSASTDGAPDISNILTDFQVSVTATNNYNGEIIYLPESEYRLIDLNQGFNLNKIDLYCYWKDKYNNSNQMYLPVGCCANIKLLFRHKRFFDPYN